MTLDSGVSRATYCGELTSLATTDVENLRRKDTKAQRKTGARESWIARALPSRAPYIVRDDRRPCFPPLQGEGEGEGEGEGGDGVD